MTQVSQNTKKVDSELPSINNKQQRESVKMQRDQSQQSNNVLPLTHANKRKKNKRKFRKHSPQYYQQKRQNKINRKLQEKWDSHFINDHIPDLFNKKKIQQHGKTLSKLTSQKRSITALDNNKIGGNTTVNMHPKKDTQLLPKIKKSQRAKSFNVRSIAQKVEQKTQKHKDNIKQQKEQKEVKQQIRQSKPLPQINKQKRKKSSQQSKRPLEQQKKVQQKKAVVQQKKAIVQQKPNYLQEYKKTLNELFEQKKFLNSHKQAIQSLFELIDKKSVREAIDRQLNLIGKKQSLIFKVMTSITNRQSFLQKLKQSIQKLFNNDKQALQLLDDYRTSTLATIEEILKWKKTWDSIYHQFFKKNKSFDLVYKTQNYLLTLSKSTDQILAKVNQLKLQANKKSHSQSNKQQHKQTSSPVKQNKQQTSTKKLQKTSISPNKQQKINKNINATQQKQKSQLNKSIQKPKQQKTNPNQSVKTSQNINSTKNQQTSKKQLTKLQQPKKQQTKKQQQKKQKSQPNIKKQQLKKSTDQVDKPKIKKQPQNLIITTMDPFLISLNSIQKEDKSIILKVRACQLLLIQQHYHSLKKL